MTEENETVEAPIRIAVESLDGGPISEAADLRLVVEGDAGIVEKTAEIALLFLQQMFGAEIRRVSVDDEDVTDRVLLDDPRRIDILDAGDGPESS